MRHGSLFSGIGGFDLAAEWMGWENVFHCEWNEFGQKVLKYHFPHADSHSDITKTDFTKYANRIDILTGGFPCQPFSLAGKRKGQDDERYLWHEMLRAIQEIKPTYVIAENVFGITNIDGGLVFQQVCLDLENEGYEVQPFIIPACAINAPHRRDRVWFVAYRNFAGLQKAWPEQQTTRLEQYRKLDKNATNTYCNGCYQCNCNNEKHTSKGGFDALNDFNEATMHTNSTSEQGEHIGQTRERKFNGPDSGNGFDNFQNFPTQSPICGGDDGLPTELDRITFSKWRNESIKAYGNAIVPQVAYEIFKALI
jgi:DNA (cytosine-5)-methyltransferase 1